MVARASRRTTLPQRMPASRRGSSASSPPRFWAAPNPIFAFACQHCHTEAYLDAAGLRFAALRNRLHVGSPPVAFANETLVEARATQMHVEASELEINGRVTSCRAAAIGEMAVMTDTVERIAGHPHMSLRAFVEAQR